MIWGEALRFDGGDEPDGVPSAAPSKGACDWPVDCWGTSYDLLGDSLLNVVGAKGPEGWFGGAAEGPKKLSKAL